MVEPLRSLPGATSISIVSELQVRVIIGVGDWASTTGNGAIATINEPR